MTEADLATDKRQNHISGKLLNGVEIGVQQTIQWVFMQIEKYHESHTLLQNGMPREKHWPELESEDDYYFRPA